MVRFEPSLSSSRQAREPWSRIPRTGDELPPRKVRFSAQTVLRGMSRGFRRLRSLRARSTSSWLLRIGFATQDLLTRDLHIWRPEPDADGHLGFGLGAITTTLKYDSLSQMVEEETLCRAFVRELDAAGNRTNLHYPSEATVGATYDALDRPSRSIPAYRMPPSLRG